MNIIYLSRVPNPVSVCLLSAGIQKLRAVHQCPFGLQGHMHGRTPPEIYQQEAKDKTD